MGKSNVTLSIDSEVLAAARKSGCNMSEVCEQSLAVYSGYDLEKPTLKELMNDESKKEFKERMIKAVSRNPVQFAKNYAKMIHVHYGYKFTPTKIMKYVQKEVDK